jgi:hypothetical protein
MVEKKQFVKRDSKKIFFLLILANVGAATESCPYISSAYLTNIEDF